MKISSITTVSPVQLSTVGTTEARSNKSKADQPVTQDPIAASVTSPSPLSEETKKNLTFATQEVVSQGEHPSQGPAGATGA